MKKTNDRLKLPLKALLGVHGVVASVKQQLLLSQIPLLDQLEGDLSGSLKLSSEIHNLDLGGLESGVHLGDSPKESKNEGRFRLFLVGDGNIKTYCLDSEVTSLVFSASSCSWRDLISAAFLATSLFRETMEAVEASSSSLIVACALETNKQILGQFQEEIKNFND